MDTKQSGWQHFAEADWAAARDAFAAVLEAEPGDPEALDGLGPVAVVAGRAGRGDRPPPSRRTPSISVAATAGAPAVSPPIWPGSTASTAGRRRPRVGCRGRGGCSPTPAPARSWAGWRSRKPSGRAIPRTPSATPGRALEIAHELADADVECMALAQLGRAVVSQGRVEEGRGAARRGDDGRARRRVERPARVRRRLLHDAGRLRRALGPAPRGRVVRGGGRVHGAPPVPARAVVVPRDLRRGPRAGGRLGARRGGARRGLETGHGPAARRRPDAAAGGARGAATATGPDRGGREAAERARGRTGGVRDVGAPAPRARRA